MKNIKRKIKFRIDEDGEWEEMYVDGELIMANHTLDVSAIAAALNYCQVADCEVVEVMG